MRYPKIRSIDKLYFGYEEIARILGISLRSARVSANRYVKQDLLVRTKRNIYVLKDRWNALAPEETFALANLIQIPSYISLMTALSYYDVTTQIQRDYVESIDIKRTKEVRVEKTIFSFNKIDRKLYFGFSREKGFFIASPEKAFLDAAYLASINRYDLDISSIDLGKLNISKLRKVAERFPDRTKRMLKKWIS